MPKPTRFSHAIIRASSMVVLLCACTRLPALAPTAMPTARAWDVTPSAPPTVTAPATMRPTIVATSSPTSSAQPDFLFVNQAMSSATNQGCIRPSKWQSRTITLDDGTAIRAVEDPCVIQAVLDDYAIAAPAEPTFLTREQMRSQATQYRSDKDLRRVYSEWWFKQFIDDEHWLGAAHHVCDQPMQRNLRVGRFLPTVNGNPLLLQLHFVLKPTNNLPFVCELRNFRDEQPSKNGWRIERSAADLTGPTPYPLYVTYATWNDGLKSWQFQVSFPTGSYGR